MQFTKLFESILDSTIWQESPSTKVLWVTMLAMSDRNGEIHASIPGLAKRAGISLEECETGLSAFLSPDKYSRTTDYEGRRIEEIDGGWCLLNHAKYRELLSKEERKEYNRRKQAQYRARKRDESVIDMSLTVIDSQSQSAMSTHTEAEAEAEADIKISSAKADSSSSGDDADAIKQAFDLFWAAYPRKVGKGQARKSWTRAKRERRLPDLTEIMTALDAATNSEQWQDSHLIPHPATWLNREGWEDEHVDFKKAPQLRGVRPPMVFDPADNIL